MTTINDTTLRLQTTVDVPAEHAFRVFTERFDEIKPRDHNLMTSPIVETVFETHVGGHVYDRAEDGSECRWARVLAFEPPDRFVISWDISPTWQIETDLDRTSEVEVTFVEDEPGRTLVTIEHRHLDRHGDGWESMIPALGNDAGWPLYLERYAAAVKG